MLKKTTGRQDWLDARKNYIGASEIGAILGLDKYKSRAMIWAEKTGRIENDVDNVAILNGQLFEPVIADVYQYAEFDKKGELIIEKYRENVENNTPICLLEEAKGVYVSDEYEFASCTPDRFAYFDPLNKLLEIKTINQHAYDQWEAGVPPQYVAQVNWQMGVTGIHRADLLMLIGGTKYKLISFEFDKELWETMIEEAKIFWDYVRKNIEPLEEGTEAYFEYLKKRPEIISLNLNDVIQEDQKLALYEEAEAEAENIKKVKESIKAEKEKEQGSKNKIIKIMQDLGVNTLEFEGNALVQKASFKENKSGNYTFLIK